MARPQWWRNGSEPFYSSTRTAAARGYGYEGGARKKVRLVQHLARTREMRQLQNALSGDVGMSVRGNQNRRSWAERLLHIGRGASRFCCLSSTGYALLGAEQG